MKNFKKIMALIAICLLLFGVNKIVVDNVYLESSMSASWKEKRQAAMETNGSKVLIIGGSASNLGFDSACFQQLSGLPCVNLSISASVPLRCYMQMARSSARSGDTVFMILESNYLTNEFRVIDESYADITAIDPELRCEETGAETYQAMYVEFFRSFTRLNDLLNFKLQEITEQPSLYVSGGVNEHGDFIRHENKSREYVRESATGVFEANEETLVQIVGFIDEMRERDVSVYVSYAPTDGYRFTNYQEYYSEMQATVETAVGKAHIIGTPFDFLYDEDCFYDTEYHLLYENKGMYTEDFYEAYNQTVGHGVSGRFGCRTGIVDKSGGRMV